MQRINSINDGIGRVCGSITAALFVLAFDCLVVTILAAGTVTAASRPCSPPAADYGKDVTAVTIPSAGTYRVWSHLKAPSAAADSYLLQIDSGQCFLVGGGASITSNAWTWVNYANGDPTEPISLANLAAGSHTFTLLGSASGVSVDDILVTTDTSCIPVADGSNCDISTTASPSTSAGISSSSSGGTFGAAGATRSACAKANSAQCKPKDKNWWVASIVGLVVLAAAGGGWYWWRRRGSQS